MAEKRDGKYLVFHLVNGKLDFFYNKIKTSCKILLTEIFPGNKHSIQLGVG